MAICRKCAFALEDDDPPERCPNCGTPTRTPADEPVRTSVPLANLRISAGRRDSEKAPPAHSADPGSTRASPLTNPDEDLPAPVPSMKAFTMPRLVSGPRIKVSTLGAGLDLESSSELDLPNPNDLSTAQRLLPEPSAIKEDVEVDLGDAKAPAQPPTAEPEAKPASRLPPPRARRVPPPPTPAPTPTPTAAAYGGLLGLFAAFLALWWLYFSQGADTPSSGTLIGHVRKSSSPSALKVGDHEHFEALLDGDRLQDYSAAISLVEERHDLAGLAEAALRIDLRYGPDPVRVALAEASLAQLDPGDPRTLRIRALAALSRNDLEQAARDLALASEPWVSLYRGLAAYQGGDYDAASAFASAALRERPHDRAARWLDFAAKLGADRHTALDPLRAEVDGDPSHLALRLLLVDALIQRGLFVEARRRLEAIARPIGSSDSNYAGLLLRHARIAAATVELSRSMYWADEALRQSNHPAITRAILRLLIQADEVGRAQQGLANLLRNAPADPEVSELQAELALRAGNESAAERAIERLASGPKRSATVLYFRGRLAALGGRDDEATADFLAAATADPPSIPAALEYVARTPRVRTEEALALLDGLAERVARDPREAARQDARALARARADLLDGAERRDAAIAVLDAAIVDDPDDSGAQLRRGELYLAKSELEKGRADLLAVLDRTGGYPGLVGPLARLLIRSGQLARLEEILQPQFNDARAPNEVLLAVAELRLAQGSIETADSLADNILLRNPNLWEAHLIKSKVYLSRGELGAAQTEITAAKAKHSNAELELTAGKIHEQSGHLQDALAAYRRSCQLDPAATEPRFRYGSLLLQLGRLQDALTELAAATKAHDAPPEAFLAQGQALYQKGHLVEAVRSFEQAAAMDPRLMAASYWLGRCHAERKEYSAAIVALTRATSAADGAWLADAYLWLGRSAVAVDDAPTALAAFDRYLTLAPPRAPGRREAETQKARLTRGP